MSLRNPRDNHEFKIFFSSTLDLASGVNVTLYDGHCLAPKETRNVIVRRDTGYN